MPNPYATQDPPGLLWLEQVNFVAVYLGAVGYGLNIAVTGICAYYLVTDRSHKSKQNLRWLVFVLVLFCLGSVNIALNMRFSQQVYIDNRNYPGGPLAYLLEQQAVATNIAGNSEAIVISFLADALLIYRAYIVYARWWILPIPILAWLAATIFGALTCVQASHPQSSLWANTTLNFSVPYFSIIMGLNILLTCLLIGRLLYMRYKIIDAIGPHHGRTYSNIATILLESALPYGIISLIFVSLYGSHNTAANLFIPLFIQIQCIAPILIILRVARGRAWSAETVSDHELSKIKFGSSNFKSKGSTTRGNGSNEVLSMMAFKPGHKESLGLVSEV